MAFIQKTLQIQSKKAIQLIDITDQVLRFCQESGFEQAMVLVSSHHSTGAIRINEKCDAIEKDFLNWIQEYLPPEKDYEHNKIAVDGRPNAHSHLLAYLLSASETLIFKKGQLQLGTWQRLFFIELDGPRDRREVKVTMMS